MRARVRLSQIRVLNSLYLAQPRQRLTRVPPPPPQVLVNNTVFIYCANSFGQGPYSIVALDGLQMWAWRRLEPSQPA